MPMNRDERIDILLDHLQQGRDLPASTTDDAHNEIEDARLLSKVARVLTDNRPIPSRSFAQHVVMNLGSRQSVSTRRSWRSIAAASSLAALAASLLLVVTLSSDKEPAEVANGAGLTPNTSAVALANAPIKTPEKVTVSDAVRQGTVAYMELVDELTATIAPSPTPAVETVLTSSSPLGRAVEGSSKTIRTAGEGLRVSVDPITSSAMDAFGFLWRPAGSTENKPST